MADHVVGTMDTSAQEKTFAGFVKFSKYSTITFLLILAFIALVNG